MRFPHPSSWLLVAIMVVGVLGHICALPFHAHAGAITAHEEGQSHHSGQHPDGDAVHAGSCEVVKSAHVGLDGVMPASLGVVSVVTAESPHRSVDVDSAIVFSSPPLFLLHAALLI
jgi:hypothetical protein